MQLCLYIQLVSINYNQLKLQQLQLVCMHIAHMSGGQNYLFPAIATGETGSSPIGCEDFRSLITSSSKRCSLY